LVKCEELAQGGGNPFYAGYTTYRIMYTSSYATWSASGPESSLHAAATGFAFVPNNAATDRSVIAWTHGGTGNNTSCGPTVQKAIENNSSSGDWIGWMLTHNPNAMLVYPDYTGLGADAGARASDNAATVVDTQAPYATLPLHTQPWTGVSTLDGLARPTIDAVRAAASLPNAHRGTNNKFLVIGYSQGGYAALATGEVQPTYAPELDLTAVYAGDPGQETQTVYGDDTPQLSAHLVPLGVANLSTIASSFSLSTVLTQANQALFAHTDGMACAFYGGFEYWVNESTLYGNLQLVTTGTAYSDYLAAAKANTPGYRHTIAPIVILQVNGDPIITIQRTDALVARENAVNPGNVFYCKWNGQNLNQDWLGRLINHDPFDYAMFDINPLGQSPAGNGICDDGNGNFIAAVNSSSFAANIAAHL
jgi:hypothetical protein